MREKVDELYQELFRAEEENNESRVKEVRKQIEGILQGKEIKRLNTDNMEEIEEYELKELSEKKKAKIEFFYKTRKKAFHKNMRNLIEKYNPDDIELAMALTSMLTHGLIEMQKEDEEVYKLLDINVLTETVHDFLKGDMSSEEVLEVIDEYWTDELLTKLIKEDNEDE